MCSSSSSGAPQGVGVADKEGQRFHVKIGEDFAQGKILASPPECGDKKTLTYNIGRFSSVGRLVREKDAGRYDTRRTLVIL